MKSFRLLEGLEVFFDPRKSGCFLWRGLVAGLEKAIEATDLVRNLCLAWQFEVAAKTESLGESIEFVKLNKGRISFWNLLKKLTALICNKPRIVGLLRV